ncbi:hypothetical protein FCH28_07565 [Streptomyces piniterrae]|uniref:Uncharacterized protein n=1 Tax=Streptomyces piniterrae TaxID=2571125 RepID=A0A4U0NRP6_9ACTN|nr:hypothetical protein [Streptomyces piniterrae]TJZ57281.1 hypothetical protein FCH28_07565 [Streptomyces piniterrae]
MSDDLLLVRAREMWVELAGTPVEFCPSGGVGEFSHEELVDVARLRAVLPVLDVLGPASLF